jgi:signal transduction histidine kinase
MAFGWQARNAHHSVILLAIAAAIPLLLFSGWVAYLSASWERSATQAAASEVVNRVAERVSAELAKQIEIAAALAATASLDQPDLGMFYREALRMKSARPMWETVELVDRSGHQVLNLLRPVGTELGATADRENFEKVVRTREPAVGGIGPVGPISGKRLVALRAPVERSGELKYVLTIALVPDAVSQILQSAGVPPGSVGAIVDAKGDIVARTLSEAFELGRPASQAVRDAVARAPEGRYTGRTLEGIETETVYRTLAGTGGWSVHLGLPTQMLNAPVTRSVILLAGGCAVSLALAGALVWLTARDIAQRRSDQELRTTIALNAIEERRAMAVEAAELGTFSLDLDADEFLASPRSRDFLELQGASQRGSEWIVSARSFIASVHPDDRARVEATFRECAINRTPVDIEFRVIAGDGHAHWRRSIGRVQSINAERPGVIQGVIADIGPKKQAEAERRDLLRQLQEVQENEQRRIARELHDQIGQTVTGLLLGLKGLADGLDGTQGGGAFRERARWLQSLATTIGRDIHQVAAELRPTALDDLGLYGAIASLSSELEKRHGLRIDLQTLGDLARLPPEIETTVYRIAQEALTNVLKHAHAKAVSVVLKRSADRLSVIIEDDGVGFDAGADETIRQRRRVPRALGLSGIKERLALVGGSMRIESDAGSGTTIFIDLPLAEADATL